LIISTVIIIVFLISLDSSTIFCEDKTTITAENVTFNIYGLTTLANSIGNTAAFSGGLGAAAKLLKSKAYPLGFKFLFVGAGGLSSLILYSATTKILSGKNVDTVDLNAQVADQTNSSNITVKFRQNGSEWEETSVNSPFESGEVSNLLSIFDDLKYLSFLMVLISFLALIFFMFKYLGEKEEQHQWIEKLPLNKKLRNFLRYIIQLWLKTNFLWGFSTLLLLSINLSFNCFIITYLNGQFHTLLS
jgi:hypothetical protein